LLVDLDRRRRRVGSGPAIRYGLDVLIILAVECVSAAPGKSEERDVNVKELVAIDIHTHAEEPCGTHPDDGYDDLQAAMAVYFNQPNNRPTIEETARYYRDRKIGAVIFPVDAERETGYRRFPNEEWLRKPPPTATS
jgi:hypothetical protein